MGYDWKDVLIDEMQCAVYTANPKRVDLVKNQHNEFINFVSYILYSQGWPGYLRYESKKKVIS
jgi:hypothetical protein